MKNYFYSKFPEHLSLLDFNRPNRVIQEYMNNDPIVFFGGPNWENAANDLSRIPAGHRPHFVLSLFMITLTDQCLFTHHRHLYEEWRMKTNFPKFGHSGFGIRNENPLIILRAPEEKGLIEIDATSKMMPEFVGFFLEETRKLLDKTSSTTNLENYIRSIKNDRDYQLNEGILIQAFKRELEARTNQAHTPASAST
ncbi:hypothetical protein [Sphaerotilus hippei]|uniref:hypothetical protein n=1 Tax=Sphaerotilus hippei TaxID=744406 RepID=UPI0011B4DB8E|nr:hypothetical protein [Sphaerotilus hippei]